MAESFILTELMGKVNFGEYLDILLQNGVYEIVFPFLLIYALVFSILSNFTGTRSKKRDGSDYVIDRRDGGLVLNKKIIVLISVCIAFFGVVFPVNGKFSECSISASIGTFNKNCATLGDYMISIFPSVSVISIAVLIFYIVAGLFGIDIGGLFGDGKKSSKWILLGVIGIYILMSSLQLLNLWESGGVIGKILRDPFLWTFLVFVLIFRWVTSKDSSDNEDGGTGGTPPAGTPPAGTPATPR